MSLISFCTEELSTTNMIPLKQNDVQPYRFFAVKISEIYMKLFLF